MSFQEHWLAVNRIPWGGLQAGNAVLEPELLCSYDLIQMFLYLLLLFFSQILSFLSNNKLSS